VLTEKIQVWNIGLSRREFTLSVSGDGLMVECLDYFTRGGQLYMITGSWDSTAMVRPSLIWCKGIVIFC
jgi:hypothetical protein